MDDQQRRLFLALLLSAGAVFLMMFLFKPPVPPPATEGTGSSATAEQTPQRTSTTPEGIAPTPEAPPTVADGTGASAAASAASPSMEPTAPAIEALPPQPFLGVDYLAEYTNIGARLSLLRILAPEQYTPRDDFGVFPTGGETRNSFTVTLGGVPALAENSAYTFIEADSVLAEPGTDPVTPSEEGDDEAAPAYSRLVYRWTDGQSLEVDKIFTRDEERPYVGGLELVIRDLSGAGREIDNIDVHLWADATGSQAGSMLNPRANAVEAACFVNAGLEHETDSDIQGQSFTGPAYWAGVQDRYFLTAIAVAGEQVGLGCSFDADLPYVSSALRLDGVVVGPNQEARIQLLTYTGPKSSDALKLAGSELHRSVDFGIFGFLAKPMHWVLTFFYNFIPNWGLAIIFLTIIVKLLLFPWTQKSFKSMERMRRVQPEMTKLREKYKNDKAKLTEETMKLYREHNVNPLGCLPMLLQMPIYIALYRMIYSSVEIYKAPFALWVQDLSEPDPYFILPVLMSVTMFGQQLLMPSSVDNPQMKWVMRLMPVMFGVFMLFLPSGLVLYIFISSLLGILQQWLIRRQAREKTPEQESTPPSKQTRQQRRQAARRQRS